VIETWKIVREADRFRLQILATAGSFWEPWVRRRHDRTRDQNLTVTQGERGVDTKIAVADRLLVMNDSILYPLGEVEALLPRIEPTGPDVAGTIAHRAFRKVLRRRHAIRVIESYPNLARRSQGLGRVAAYDCGSNLGRPV
jgi:hypothetical protein